MGVLDTMTFFASTYEELEAYIRRWTSWSGDGYDFGGIVGLVAACLSNIGECANEGDLADFAERLEPEQQEVLVRLAALIEAQRDAPAPADPTRTS